MLNSNNRREITTQYHNDLPDEIRTYLKGRGIPATVIENQQLGWNGERIVIPIFGRGREVLGFRYAKVLNDSSDDPDVQSDIQLGTQLYGLDRLLERPRRVVICDGEFDRLVLESNGIAAVTSTGGAHEFLEEWLPYLEPVKYVYVCFRRDLAGAVAARKIERLLPRAIVVTLPPEVGQKGTITDFFVELGRTKIDFEVLLAGAAVAKSDDPAARPPEIRVLQPHHRSVRKRAENVRRDVRLHEVVSQYVDLEAEGARLAGHCPFYDDRKRSFAVYPQADTYSCSCCGAKGDVVQFVMDKESKTVGQALYMLEDFSVTHELYGTS